MRGKGTGQPATTQAAGPAARLPAIGKLSIPLRDEMRPADTDPESSRVWRSRRVFALRRGIRGSGQGGARP